MESANEDATSTWRCDISQVVVSCSPRHQLFPKSRAKSAAQHLHFVGVGHCANIFWLGMKRIVLNWVLVLTIQKIWSMIHLKMSQFYSTSYQKGWKIEVEQKKNILKPPIRKFEATSHFRRSSWGCWMRHTSTQLACKHRKQAAKNNKSVYICLYIQVLSSFKPRTCNLWIETHESTRPWATFLWWIMVVFLDSWCLWHLCLSQDLQVLWGKAS